MAWTFFGKTFSERLVILLLVSLSLSVEAGCASNNATGPYFQEAGSIISDKASVYFYRPPSSGAPDRWSSRVYAWYDLIGELDHGGYFVHYLKPGRYRISNTRKDVPDDIWLTVEAGQQYFIKWNYRIRSSFLNRSGSQYSSYLTSVDVEEALEELKLCRLMVLK